MSPLPILGVAVIMGMLQCIYACTDGDIHRQLLGSFVCIPDMST